MKWCDKTSPEVPSTRLYPPMIGTAQARDQADTRRLTSLPSGFGSGTKSNHPWGTSVGFPSTINPTMVNEFRGGFVRPTFGFLPPFNAEDLCTQLGIPNCNTSLLGGIAL